ICLGLLSLILLLSAKVTTANKTDSFLFSTGLTVLSSPGLKMRVLGRPPTPPHLAQGHTSGYVDLRKGPFLSPMRHPRGHTGPQILPQAWEPFGRRVRQCRGPQTFLKGPESKYFRLCGPQVLCCKPLFCYCSSKAAIDNSEVNECVVSQ
uniref:Uncharacterized protein n=1 Tax=Pongo abelii TaxID=9601 RepID=H2PEY8_PONAB